MDQYVVRSIGKVLCRDEGRFFIKLDDEYVPGLKGLNDFSHLCVTWWFHQSDSDEERNILKVPSPYKKVTESLGIFATRSPFRPNPIALSTVQVLGIDLNTGSIETTYIDAEDGTPVVDIKPYTPSLDRVENPSVPEWSRHWPKSYETSGDFDWENEFNF